MKLPTMLGRKMLEDHFKARCEKDIDSMDAIATFQSLALAGSTFDECWEACTIWFKVEGKRLAPNCPERTKAETIHNLVKQDVLGLAVGALTDIASSTSAPAKDRTAAAIVLQELYGDKDLIQKDTITDRLVMNFQGK